MDKCCVCKKDLLQNNKKIINEKEYVFCDKCLDKINNLGNKESQSYILLNTKEEEIKEYVKKQARKVLEDKYGLTVEEKTNIGCLIVTVLIIIVVVLLLAGASDKSNNSTSRYKKKSSNNSTPSFSEYLKEQNEDLYYSSKGRYYDALGL